MAAMFSNVRPAGPASGHIVEFKAGRSRLEAGSSESMRRVIAEPTKGLVYIKQSNDQLMHFCWKDRETGAQVDDLIIFPDDAEFKAVTGCTDGKVYMLKFKSSGEMKLFWLQDSAPDVDKDIVKKVNDALNKPPTSRPSASRSTASNSNAERPSAGGSLAASSDFNAPLGGLDQSQLMSLIQSLQGGNSSDALPAPQAAAAAENAEADCEPPAAASGSSGQSSSGGEGKLVLNSQIQSIINNFGRQKKDVSVSLGEALSNDAVAEVVREHAEELTPLLPQTGEEELSRTVKTPQFRQAADTLGHALQTGQLGPVLEQFGMNEETVQAAANGDIRGFARNLTKAEGGSQPGEPSKTQNSDEDVAREPEPKRNRPDLDDMDCD
ncbi:unnamed protein product [Caenorhabditis sp. 36 PRJEB53466]|nr:unnamed protein product [Caenorhabditis sp. 36 PRJEB53466]